MALQIYMDDSGSDDPDWLVLAGYIATTEQWSKFSAEWQAQLDQKPKLPSFKMNRMKPTPEQLERSQLFYKIIESHVQAAVSCTISTADLNRIIGKNKWLLKTPAADRITNPYYIAFAALVTGLAHHQHRLGFSQPVDFIFDNNKEKTLIRHEWEYLRFSSTAATRRLIGEKPVFGNSKKLLPLQAAWLFAHWTYVWHRDNKDDASKNRVYPWNSTKGIPHLHKTFMAKDLDEYFWASQGRRFQKKLLTSEEEIRHFLDTENNAPSQV